MPIDSRFDGDILPDATWGTCRLHSPAGIVRLVDDHGRPTPNGVCESCYAESHDDQFFSCPIHGINPKSPAKEGCPVDGCLGASAGPTQEEIEREALAIGSVWPGGPPKLENAVDAPPAGPAGLGAGQAGGGAGDQAGGVPVHDPARILAPGTAEPAATALAAQGVTVQPRGRAPETPRVPDPATVWVDPFLMEE